MVWHTQKPERCYIKSSNFAGSQRERERGKKTLGFGVFSLLAVSSSSCAAGDLIKPRDAPKWRYRPVASLYQRLSAYAYPRFFSYPVFFVFFFSDIPIEQKEALLFTAIEVKNDQPVKCNISVKREERRRWRRRRKRNEKKRDGTFCTCFVRRHKIRPSVVSRVDFFNVFPPLSSSSSSSATTTLQKINKIKSQDKVIN